MIEKEVVGFPNYVVNSTGEVTPKNREKPLSAWVDNVGYYQVLLYKKGKRHYKRIHNLMSEAFLVDKKKDEELEVNHIDGDKLNNHISNLELVTPSENTQEGYEMGLYKTNSRNIDVDVYCKKEGSYIKTFPSIRSLSRELGLNRKTVSAIMFDGKTNNYDYTFKPIIKEKFFFIEIFDEVGSLIDVVPSLAQASKITRIDRHKLSDIVHERVKNNSSFIFRKKYKQCSQETIENTPK